MSTDAADELTERVRAALPHRNRREKRMFGVLAFMVDDAMVVAVRKDGGLLVHVDPADDARLLGEPGASRPEMGAGRSMGVGWIQVESSALTEGRSLDEWLDRATDYLARRHAKD